MVNASRVPKSFGRQKTKGPKKQRQKRKLLPNRKRPRSETKKES